MGGDNKGNFIKPEFDITKGQRISCEGLSSAGSVNSKVTFSFTMMTSLLCVFSLVVHMLNCLTQAIVVVSPRPLHVQLHQQLLPHSQSLQHGPQVHGGHQRRWSISYGGPSAMVVHQLWWSISYGGPSAMVVHQLLWSISYGGLQLS